MITRSATIAKGVKRVLKVVSTTLCHYFFLIPAPQLLHYKKFLISTWQNSGKRSLIDRWLFPIVFKSWVEHEYLTEPDPNQRENLKSIAMGGAGSRNWGLSYANSPIDGLFHSQVGNITFREACPIHFEIDSICSDDMPELIVQIGCGSGRMIGYYAHKYPEVRCIGTDAFAETLEVSEQHQNSPNLSFELFPAHKLIELLKRFSRSNILIFSSGSLKYVQPEHLIMFFQTLVTLRHANIKILIQETANELEGSPDKLQNSLWDGEFKYTHAYKHQAESAGLRTVKSQIIRPYLPYDKFPTKRPGTVHYFYFCQSTY